MLITQVKMNQNLLIGEFVQWSSSENQFVKCTDHMQMVGVVDQLPTQSGSDYVGVIRQAGVATAIAGENIPEQGGALSINSEGRAIISTGHSCGIIQAQPYGQPARVAGDSVVIWLR